MNKKIDHPRSMEQYQTTSNICVIGVPEGKKENQAEKKYL